MREKLLEKDLKYNAVTNWDVESDIMWYDTMYKYGILYSAIRGPSMQITWKLCKKQPLSNWSQQFDEV